MFIEMMNEKQRRISKNVHSHRKNEKEREGETEIFTQIVKHTRAPTITEYRDVFNEFTRK